MISRLSASAALFAVLATVALTFATETHAQHVAAARIAVVDVTPAGVILLPAVTVIGHRNR